MVVMVACPDSARRRAAARTYPTPSVVSSGIVRFFYGCFPWCRPTACRTDRSRHAICGQSRRDTSTRRCHPTCRCDKGTCACGAQSGQAKEGVGGGELVRHITLQRALPRKVSWSLQKTCQATPLCSAKQRAIAKVLGNGEGACGGGGFAVDGEGLTADGSGSSAPVQFLSAQLRS